MDQTKRIELMEAVLCEGEELLEKLGEDLNAYSAMLERLQSLENYYGSEEWHYDYDCDRAGLLPPTLKRGVLSEDAVYDLLELNDALLRQMEEILSFRDR